MNKWVNIALVSVLLVVSIVNGVLYFQQSAKLNDTISQLDQLEGTVSGYGADISGLQGNVSTLEGGFAGLQNDLTILDDSFAGLQTDVANLDSGVTALQGSLLTLDGNFSALQGDFSLLEGDFSTLEVGVSALEGDFSILSSNFSGIESSVSTLESGVAALGEDVSALEAYDQAVINVAAMLEPSTVMLIADLGGGMFGAGSGVIVSSDGWVLTNWHVLFGAQDILVVFSDGTVYDGVMPHTEHDFFDLAMVKIDSNQNDFIPATLGSSDNVTVGEAVLAIGFPQSFTLDIPLTVSQGIVSATRIAFFDGMEYIQTDAATNPGNSGGPLVNLKGEVIGLNNWKFYLGMVGGERVFAEGLNFALPIDYAKSFIAGVIS